MGFDPLDPINIPAPGRCRGPHSYAQGPHFTASEHLDAHPGSKSHPGRARSRITRQEWGKAAIPAPTERPGEHKPLPEGSRGLPRREQRSPRGEQRSPPRGAKVSLMGFKVFPGDAKVSSEGRKGLPPKGAQVSPRRERSEDLPSKGSKALPPGTLRFLPQC